MITGGTIVGEAGGTTAGGTLLEEQLLRVSPGVAWHHKPLRVLEYP